MGNGRKCITTVQGLDQQLDLKKISKTIKKAHCCNGSIVEDEDMGQVLQFQGDQRDAVMNFLTENDICTKDKIKKHGHGQHCQTQPSSLRPVMAGKSLSGVLKADRPVGPCFRHRSALGSVT